MCRVFGIPSYVLLGLRKLGAFTKTVACVCICLSHVKVVQRGYGIHQRNGLAGELENASCLSNN